MLVRGYEQPQAGSRPGLVVHAVDVNEHPSRALCGAEVVVTGTGAEWDAGDPDACVVCRDLAWA